MAAADVEKFRVIYDMRPVDAVLRQAALDLDAIGARWSRTLLPA
jgi:hypothetical protein